MLTCSPLFCSLKVCTSLCWVWPKFHNALDYVLREEHACINFNPFLNGPYLHIEFQSQSVILSIRCGLEQCPYRLDVSLVPMLQQPFNTTTLQLLYGIGLLHEPHLLLEPSPVTLSSPSWILAQFFSPRHIFCLQCKKHSFLQNRLSRGDLPATFLYITATDLLYVSVPSVYQAACHCHSFISIKHQTNNQCNLKILKRAETQQSASTYLSRG